MFNFAQIQTNPLRQAITAAYRRDEVEAVTDMITRANVSNAEKQAAYQLGAFACVQSARRPQQSQRRRCAHARNLRCLAKKAWH